MKTISFVNEKGGVGKSASAVHVACGLAATGLRVVLCDADPQGHAGLMLGKAKEPGLYDLLVRKAPFKNVLRFVSPEVYEQPGKTVKGQLFLLPSNVLTSRIATSINDVFAVAHRFRELREGVDIVIFDTPPTPSLLHGSIYMTTDAILYPTKLDALSFDGLVESLRHREESDVSRVQRGMSEIKMLGVIPTMYRKNTAEHADNLTELRGNFGDLVWEPLAQATVWESAARIGRTVWNAAPKTKPAKEAWRMVEQMREVLAHV